MMLPGTYRFSTIAAEIIDVTQGSCRVKLEDKQDWFTYEAGDRFNIPAHSSFEIEAIELFDYVCHFES